MECAFNSRECVIFLISFEIKVRTCYFMFFWKEKQSFYIIPAAITCSKLTIKVPEQGMKYVQSKKKDQRTISLTSFWSLDC